MSSSTTEQMDIDQLDTTQDQVKSLDDDDHVPRMVMIKSKKNQNGSFLSVNA
jgi:hypothetical protein